MQEVDPSRSGADQGGITVIIDGDPGTHFTANLVVHNNDETETHAFSGEVPRHLEYSGSEVEAEIRQTSTEGRLTVEVRKAGNVSRSSSSGKDSQIRLRVR